MSELCYAVVQKLGNIHPSRPYPSDMAIDNHEEYYRLLQTSSDPNCLTVKQLQGSSIKEVQKIIGATDGNLQWKVLN